MHAMIRSGVLTWNGRIFPGRWRGMSVTAHVQLELNKIDSLQSGGEQQTQIRLSCSADEWSRWRQSKGTSQCFYSSQWQAHKRKKLWDLQLWTIVACNNSDAFKFQTEKVTYHSAFIGVFVAPGIVGPRPVALRMQEPLSVFCANLRNHLCREWTERLFKRQSSKTGAKIVKHAKENVSYLATGL